MKNSNVWSFIAGVATVAVGSIIAEEVCSRRSIADRAINNLMPTWIGVNDRIRNGARAEAFEMKKLFCDGVITREEFRRRMNTINQNITASVAKYDAMENGWEVCKYEKIFKYDYFERR